MSGPRNGADRKRLLKVVTLVTVAVGCLVVSLFVPTRIGNWLAVIGLVMLAGYFIPALRRDRGGRRSVDAERPRRARR